MTLSIYNVHVSCFPVSENGDDFCVVAKSEEDALRAVAGRYASNASNWGEESDEVGRDDFDTLYTWWKEPYQKNREGYEAGVIVEKVVDLDTIADHLVLSAVHT
jgi:hypothetical protein